MRGKFSVNIYGFKGRKKLRIQEEPSKWLGE